MSPRIAALCSIFALLAGCGGDDGGSNGGGYPYYGPSSGGAGGGTTSSTGHGVGGSSPIGGGGFGNASSTGGFGNASSTGGFGAGAGPTSTMIYCGTEGAECSCGTAPATGWTQGGVCNSSTVPGPSLCCATSNWPNTDPSNLAGLGCVCSKVSCIEAGTKDYCSCGFSQSLDPGDQFVGSCSGAVCCRSKSLLAPTCYCFTSSSTSCDALGDEPVSSCGTSDVQCGDGAMSVPGCH